jgi:WD40 repeat protein
LQGVSAVTISPDGKRIISGGNDKIVKVWNFNTGKNVRNFTGHLESILSVAISPNGKFIASGSRSEVVKIWVMD